jgi:hypothetical protein
MNRRQLSAAGIIALLLTCFAGAVLEASAQGDITSLNVYYYRPPAANWNYNNQVSADPVPDGQLWLVHALISTMGGDRNGADSLHQGAMAHDWSNPAYKRYTDWTKGMNLTAPTGNDIPDEWEFAVMEYVYTHPEHPLNAQTVAAWDFNLNSIANWTENDDPCSDNTRPTDWPTVEGYSSWPIDLQPWPGYDFDLERPADFPEHLWNPSDGYNGTNPDQSAWPHIWDPLANSGFGAWVPNPGWWYDRTWFSDVPYADLFGNELPPNVFGGTCDNDKYDHFGLRGYAGHATVSDEGVGPYSHITGMWSYFNQMRENPIDFNTDPRFNRSVVQYFGGNGDANGDGLTNRQKYDSFDRAWTAGWRPPGYTTLVAPPEFLSRAQQDAAVGAYINFVLYYTGFHPFDPTPPPLTIASQSQGGWIQIGPTEDAQLSVDMDFAVNPVTYQWYKDGDALLTGDPHYVGVQSSTLTIKAPVTSQNDSGTYWCVITDGRPAKATVVSAPMDILFFAPGELPVAGALGLGLLGSALALVAARRRFRR